MTDKTQVCNAVVSLINKHIDASMAWQSIQNLNFSDLGLDSETAVILTGELSDRFELDIDPLIIFEHANVTEFVDCIVHMLTEQNIAGG